MYASALSLFAFIASQAAASSVLSSAGAPHGFLDIVRRATNSSDISGNIPAACTSDCKILTDPSGCASTDAACLCTDARNKGSFACYECILGFVPDQMALDEGQKMLADYETACAQADITLASLSLMLPGTTSPAGPTAPGGPTFPGGTTSPGTTSPGRTTSPGATTPTGTPKTGTGAAASLFVNMAAVGGAVGAALAALL
ncbi:uncharacterized protein BXZ73DRAFT_75019 [Epithele typhae]|uniref:uncharacterized protein n=1 Tax=Epithele typhae TaxID=378194 RepID=UPI0020086C02|nr:uncharacterized protein BXZ73DRAFT_75019 [Epithele typhae]KAH9941841.1 hypothetical protein BXZ73DRAFT_75019 [Epithele typhae]